MFVDLSILWKDSGRLLLGGLRPTGWETLVSSSQMPMVHFYVKEPLGVRQCGVADFSQLSWERELPPFNPLNGGPPLPQKRLLGTQEEEAGEVPGLREGTESQDMW